MMTFELVRWNKNDSNDFYIQSNDEALYENMSDTFPKSFQECEKAVEYFSKSNDETEYIRAILINNQIAGCIGAFFESDIYCKNAELAYWIGKEFRGQGIMPEVIKFFTNRMFKDTEIIRIYARPFAYNKSSQKVLEKAGYSYEGTMKKSVFKHGIIFDAMLYATIRK